MTKADEDAIREIELRFNEAWGRHDAGAMVESLVDDAQFVTVNGAWTKTRCLTTRFSLIVEALARLRSRSCSIDGEAVACCPASQ